MTAGLKQRINIWRINYGDDDAVGGAVTTGTSVYNYVAAQLHAHTPNQLLLQQGLEVDRTYNMVVIPGTLDIRERDEVEITHPWNDPYIQQRFRIVGVQYSDLIPNDRRSYIRLNLVRSVRSHGRQ